MDGLAQVVETLGAWGSRRGLGSSIIATDWTMVASVSQAAVNFLELGEGKLEHVANVVPAHVGHHGLASMRTLGRWCARVRGGRSSVSWNWSPRGTSVTTQAEASSAS
jgi:hypothetical protein